MSIYATIFEIGGEHGRNCTRMTKIGKRMYEQDDSKPCTCKTSPITFQHSGVLPSASDKRSGCFMLAAIPSHITRDGRDNMPEGRWHPWLRVSVFDVESDSFILDKKQVEKLRDSLSEWLKSAGRRGGSR